MLVLSDFQEPDSVIKHQQNNTKAIMDKRELGTGTLYITESLLSWQGPHGFSIPYPNISMHALSKDTKLYPTDCLLVIIDKHVQLPGVQNGLQQRQPNNPTESDDSDNESEDGVSELIFEPEDKTALQQMYEAIRDCQELHPDPEDMSTDEDEAFEDMTEEGFEDDGRGDGQENLDDMQNLSLNEQNQRNGYEGGDQRQDMDEDQFEDAD